MNTNTTALVTTAGISFDDGKTHSIERDSEEWRQWFTTTPEGSKIRFEWLNSYLHRNTYTAYRRKRYWEAQKRVDGKLRNTTIKPEEATYQKLEQVGSELTAYNWNRAEQKHQHKSGNNEIYQTSSETPSQVAAEIEQLRAEVEQLRKRESYLLDQLGLVKAQIIHEAQERASQLEARVTELDNANWQCEKNLTIVSELHQKSELKRQELQSLVDDYQTKASISLDGIKRYKLHGREVVRVEDLITKAPVKQDKVLSWEEGVDAVVGEL